MIVRLLMLFLVSGTLNADLRRVAELVPISADAEETQCGKYVVKMKDGSWRLNTKKGMQVLMSG